jgi:hypothetical protein
MSAAPDVWHIGKTPWYSRAGELVAHEKYGLGWMGWRIRLDEPFGQECYANQSQLTGPARVDSIRIAVKRTPRMKTKPNPKDY